MNERIKELAEQAYQWALAESKVKDGANMCSPGSDYFLALEKKKFAELIILECSSICYKAFENGDEIAGLLMQTFGVE